MTWKREGQEVDREAVLASLANEDVNLQEVKITCGEGVHDHRRRGCFDFRRLWEQGGAHRGLLPSLAAGMDAGDEEVASVF